MAAVGAGGVGRRRRRRTTTEHQFTLVIAGDVDREEAGCDDSTFGTVDHVGYGDFFREAPSLTEAVRSATEQIEGVPGLRVLRVESKASPSPC